MKRPSDLVARINRSKTEYFEGIEKKNRQISMLIDQWISEWDYADPDFSSMLVLKIAVDTGTDKGEEKYHELILWLEWNSWEVDYTSYLDIVERIQGTECDWTSVNVCVRLPKHLRKEL